MASMDGPCEVWYWLVESCYGDPWLTEEGAKTLVACFTEEERASIEYSLESYDEDTQSWRDYRNSLWYSISKESEARFDKAWAEWRSAQGR